MKKYTEVKKNRGRKIYSKGQEEWRSQNILRSRRFELDFVKYTQIYCRRNRTDILRSRKVEVAKYAGINKK
jgi:hypothetical protein